MTSQGPTVCTECICDAGIRHFIEHAEIKGDCSFCNGRRTPVALLDDVTEHMRTCLQFEYDDANDWLIYDEGDYHIQWWDTWDLLTDEIELELPNDSDSRLLREMVDRLPGHSWCTANPYDLPDQEKVKYDWAWFSEVVMHRRRFFFVNYGRQPDSEELSPGEFLDKIFEYAESYELFQSLPSGTRLFRARFQESDAKLTSAQELGPPPRTSATQTNRMSPPGIPMFYGCDYPETAIRETANKKGRFAVGRFVIRRPAMILDLTKIPATPSLFEGIPDNLEFRPRQALRFLNHVAGEISKPIQRDDRVHVNYIPTQVVTEFVRYKLFQGGTQIAGIKYPSAVHQNHASYVLFADQTNLFPAPKDARWTGDDLWLELVSTCERDVTEEDIERWKEEIPKRFGRDYWQQLYYDE